MSNESSNDILDLRTLFETACAGEENPTATAVQLFSEVARLQFSNEDIEHAKQTVLDMLEKSKTGTYGNLLGYTSMLLVGLSAIADDMADVTDE